MDTFWRYLKSIYSI